MELISFFFFPFNCFLLRVVLAIFVSVKVQHLLKEYKVKLSVDSYSCYFWAFLD